MNRYPENRIHRRQWPVDSARLVILAFGFFSAYEIDAGAQFAENPAQPPSTRVSSYDQLTPVLLGKETFQERMAKDKARRPRSRPARRSCSSRATTSPRSPTLRSRCPAASPSRSARPRGCHTG